MSKDRNGFQGAPLSEPHIQERQGALNRGYHPGLVSAFSICEKNKESKYQKPCEDFHIADSENGIFILMDGATRYVQSGNPYPSPSPAGEAAKLVCLSAHEFLTHAERHTSEPGTLLKAAAQAANFAVRDYNQRMFPKTDYLENDLANSCGIISYFSEKAFHYCYLGDPQGYLIRDGIISLFTNTQTQKIDELYDIYSKDTSIKIEDFRRLVCSKVRNNRAHQYSFGSFTGEDAAMELLVFGRIDVMPGDKIILTSDGLLQLYSHTPQLFLGNNYDVIIKEMEKIETLFNIRSDDKTLIAINIYS